MANLRAKSHLINPFKHPLFMRNLIFPLFILLFSCNGSTQVPQKLISGYFPSWRWYDRDKLVQPATLDYSRYDIINYAFLDVEPNGSISLTDPWADKNLLLGPINNGSAPAGYDQSKDLGNPVYHQSGKRFSDYAHRNKVRLVVSLGGWAHSENFSQVAASAAARARLASQCGTIVQLYQLDGIDIDWEYPGQIERGGRAEDKQNFTLLLQAIRQALDQKERQLRRELLLTIACSAAPARMTDIDWPQVKNLVDGINLMSYAFYGHWDPVTNHNAPLFPPANATQPGFSCSEAVQNLLDMGVPSLKINLGLAFYGRTQLTTGASGLHVSGLRCPDTIAFTRNAATPQYYEIMDRYNQGVYDYQWDEVAQVPFLSGKTGIRSFVSFDDERSIALKAEFAKSRNLHGVVIWDIAADHLETTPGSRVLAGAPLATAARKVFSDPRATVSPVLMGTTVCVFPNPTPNGYLQIFTNATDRAATDLAIFNTTGEKIYSSRYMEASHRLDIRALPAGPYMVQVKRGKDKPVLVRVVKK